MATYLETIVRQTASMVERWHGHRARMAELTKSHSTLRIVVGDEIFGKNLVISCLGPLYIRGPTQWQGAVIALKPIKLDSGKQGIAVVDESNGVRVVADSVEVKENVKW